MTQATQATQATQWLTHILKTPRPAYHALEDAFVTQYLLPLLRQLAGNYYAVSQDDYGNVWAHYNGKPTSTLITCHTDTANSARYRTKQTTTTTTSANNTTTSANNTTTSTARTPAGAWSKPQPTQPTVQCIKTTTDHKTLDKTVSLDTSLPTSGCLGADDGAGIALSLAMINARKPYDFVFYRAEEVGGVGSSDSARFDEDEYRHYKRAIAFDRRGTSDVITHQAGGRCCSDTFAQALADLLTKTSSALNTYARNNLPVTGAGHLSYAPCSNGIFTDTANLTRLIPECTNISVGYQNEHTEYETLNLTHWSTLCAVLIDPTTDLNTLPTERDPLVTKRDYADWWTTPVRSTDKQDPFNAYDYDTDNQSAYDYFAQELTIDEWAEHIRQGGISTAEELVWSDPQTAAELLYELTKY